MAFQTSCPRSTHYALCSKSNTSPPAKHHVPRPVPHLPYTFPHLLQGLLDDLSGIIFDDITPPSLSPFSIVDFDVAALMVTSVTKLTYSDNTYLPITFKAKGHQPLPFPLTTLSIKRGTAFVVEAEVDFGSNLFGLSVVSGLKTQVVAFRHFPNLVLSLPSAENLNPITGNKDGAHSRAFFSVTMDSVDLNVLVNRL